MRFDPSVAVKSRAVFVGGDDSLSRAEALEKILGAVSADPSETESILGDSVTPLEWFGKSSTVPFFGERRVLVVRSVGRCEPSRFWDDELKKDHPAVTEFKGLPETALLVLVHDDEIGDDSRQQRFVTHANQWMKLLEFGGGVAFVFKVDTSKTPELVRARAKELGKTISPVAANLLSEMVGGKPELALSELEKAALYAGDSPEIRRSDVQAAVLPDAEYNVFKLADAIVASDARQAVAQLRTLFEQTPDIGGQLFPRVLPTLVGQFRLIWQARASSESKGESERSEWVPAKSLADEKDWRQRRAREAAARLDAGQIRECFRQLLQVEAEVKGQLPSLSAPDSLEQMTLRLCRICGRKS